MIEQLEKVKLLPLYTVTDLHCLPQLESILVNAGVPFIEVTFRSHLALEAIKILSRSGKLIVGAGTVRTKKEAEDAIANGARFIVSPALVDEVVQYCIEKDIPVIPGVATPRDIQSALNYGIHTVKFFPADIYGGVTAIRSLSGPFYDVRFLPTGGVNSENCLDYLANDRVVAVGGSFIISEKDVQKDPQEAQRKLNELVQKVNG
ncbi:bifunctional 4-hydroxy-2-oxoglutarate aldolase/2-dehydro-3-deoxy-phosphogluconate aldolase [Merdibacter massiliensis]|uniref:bifunctional 4-hydroxy-2-oxoglutarate aldolase/2-dehydro-3-deoxy-phosphogluconate aldolase n=1 Tax=Merdibacter massiliensis TaxID=1871030 RepID=UPI00096AC8F2|nr:bifunctional 4-hydroxy-2-oxoglutarate aldolase/2-dehydro-3-deoxy-phosphogluconate aldolase [Merdibacter massiliensis]